MGYHRLLTPLEFECVINHQVLLVFISKSNKKSGTEKKTKPNCALDGSVKLANIQQSKIVITWYLLWHLFKLYLVKNYLYFFIYFFFHNDVIFTVVCKFEMQCE